jgi:hypothetical protein
MLLAIENCNCVADFPRNNICLPEAKHDLFLFFNARVFSPLGVLICFNMF